MVTFDLTYRNRLGGVGTLSLAFASDKQLSVATYETCHRHAKKEAYMWQSQVENVPHYLFGLKLDVLYVAICMQLSYCTPKLGVYF